MYFDEDGDLAHEFYEEVLPRYEIWTAFDVVTILVVTILVVIILVLTIHVVTILTKQEKGWQEKNAKNWEESQVYPLFCVLIPSQGFCRDVLHIYPAHFFPGHRETWNTVCRVFTSTSQSFFIRTETSFKGFWSWSYTWNDKTPIHIVCFFLNLKQTWQS